jgi:hypothetical protein
LIIVFFLFISTHNFFNGGTEIDKIGHGILNLTCTGHFLEFHILILIYLLFIMKTIIFSHKLSMEIDNTAHPIAVTQHIRLLVIKDSWE